jgi:ATP-dependent Clp protease, protease subunit
MSTGGIVEDTENQEDFKIKKLDIYGTPIASATKFTVYLDGLIEEPSYYNELFFRLDTATDNDVIELVLNTLGGNEDTAIQMYNAIRQTRATVIGRISGYCCSAGSIIFLACRHWVVSPHCKFMAHSTSGGMAGKAHETKAMTEFDCGWLKDFFTEVYKGFFSPKEITEMLAGRDFWLNSEDVMKRLKRIK